MVSAPQIPDWRLAGGGEMGALIRAFDWSATALGAIENWPGDLRTAVSICLNSQFPILLFCGPDLTTLYNDACIPLLATSHPECALGRPARECWADVWDVIGPLLDRVMTAGEAATSGDLRRFRFSLSPIRDESGAVLGAFAPVAEITPNEHIEAARKRDVFLARAGAILASSLDIDRTLAAISDLAVPEIADWCAIDLIQPDAPPRRVTVRHMNPELVAKCTELRAKYPPGEDFGFGLALRSGKPVLMREVTDEDLRKLAQSEEHLAGLRELGIRSVILAPLIVHGERLGVLNLVRSERLFQPEDTDFIEQLARISHGL